MVHENVKTILLVGNKTRYVSTAAGHCIAYMQSKNAGSVHMREQGASIFYHPRSKCSLRSLDLDILLALCIVLAAIVHIDLGRADHLWILIGVGVTATIAHVHTHAIVGPAATGVCICMASPLRSGYTVGGILTTACGGALLRPLPGMRAADRASAGTFRAPKIVARSSTFDEPTVLLGTGPHSQGASAG